MSYLAEDLVRAEAESNAGKMPNKEELAALMSEFEQGLLIPEAKRTPQLLVCPVGHVGAGKTTVMKPLCKKLSLVRISTDEFRHLLKDHGFSFLVMRDVLSHLAKKYLSAGFSLGLDADCSGETKVFIDQAQQKMSDIKVVWLHIAPPERFILDKLRKYRHTWLFKDADEAIANYSRRKALHDNLDMPFLYTFDTSRADLGEQIDETVLLIEKIK